MSRTPWSAGAAAAVVAAALLAPACSGSAAAPAQAPSVSDTADALVGLEPCGPAPTQAPDVSETPPLPPEAVITEVRSVPPIVDVRGYVALTPLQVQQHYQQRDDLDLIQAENEVFEAEVLFSDGVSRIYVKALAVCDRGSSILVVVAPMDDAGAVHTPVGSPSTTGAG